MPANMMSPSKKQKTENASSNGGATNGGKKAQDDGDALWEVDEETLNSGAVG